MQLRKSDIQLGAMLVIALLIPLTFGVWIRQFPYWSHVSIPIHSLLEAAGAVCALGSASLFFKINENRNNYNVYHKVALALIPIGIFDLFHAMLSPGDLFVWLHTLSIFVGGLFIAALFLPNIPISKTSWVMVPFAIAATAIVLSILSMASPLSVPKMLQPSTEFTYAAKWMNLIGGALYLLGALFFTRRFLNNEKIIDLWLAAWLYLFSTAGVLFFFSSLWDATWWFWHFLRFIGLTSLFMLSVFLITKKLSQAQIYQNKSSLRITSLQEKKRQFQRNYQNLFNGTLNLQLSTKGIIESINTQWHEQLQQTKDDWLKMPIWIKFAIDSEHENLKQKLATLKETPKPFTATLRTINLDNDYYYQVHFHPQFITYGKLDHWLLIAADVTQFVKDHKALKASVYQDPLTKLPNRLRLNEDLQKNAFAHLALVNIDNFKSINDFYGIEFGDQVIAQLADRLQQTFVNFNLEIYRHHGDEFALITGYEASFELFEKQLRMLSDNIENGHFRVENVNLNLQISIGVVESSKHYKMIELRLCSNHFLTIKNTLAPNTKP